jgi:hypothetical protein
MRLGCTICDARSKIDGATALENRFGLLHDLALRVRHQEQRRRGPKGFLLLRRTIKAQINLGLYSSLDERRGPGHHHFQLTKPDAQSNAWMRFSVAPTCCKLSRRNNMEKR